MKRFLITCALMFSSVLPASAQKTPAPSVLQAYYDGNGDPYSVAGICVFATGTSSLATTYTTATGVASNANPLMLSSAGRPTSNGFFLTPGTSYKIVLVDFTSAIGTPTCTPINGSTVFTQDGIEAVPGSASAVDVADAVAGESIAAGDAVFLSNGACSLNAGQWYRTDSDVACRSMTTAMVGIAPSAIATAALGTVRIVGEVTVTGPLSPGLAYYVGSTPGAIVVTAPTNSLRIGSAQSATVLIVGNLSKNPVGPRAPPCGRLTLTTGLWVTVADVTAATTLYYTPGGGCSSLSVYDGTDQWYGVSLAQLSIAVPATTSQMYDVFVYDNAGTPTLELTAWTNDTTRATALATQNGIYVKTGALTRLYLGSFRTTGVSGQTEDSAAKRYVWNYYNRVDRWLQKNDATSSWNYDVATWRQANGAAANQIDLVVGVSEDAIEVNVTGRGTNSTGGVFQCAAGIDKDAATAPETASVFATLNPAVSVATQYVAAMREVPAIGRHFYAWIEIGNATGTNSFYGTSAGSFVSGITGWWRA